MDNDDNVRYRKERRTKGNRVEGCQSHLTVQKIVKIKKIKFFMDPKHLRYGKHHQRSSLVPMSPSSAE